jgi:DNA-directed RNA polymerase I, II, and III subunit RPABC1
MTESYDFYLARKTILEMLEDRKYPVDPTLKEVSFEEFHMFFEKKQIYFHVDGEVEGVPHRVYVLFFTESKTFGKKEYQTLMDSMDIDVPSYSVIIILKEKLNTVMKRELASSAFENVEFFMLNELRFNKTKYPLVPEHVLLSEEEKEDILKRYSARQSDMPVISKNDPIVRYYGGKVGQMFKITRKTKAGIVYYYRVIR